MASSSSSHQQNERLYAFSEIEPAGKTRMVSASSRLFDVFINHRGPDVKKTLAADLYKSLKQLGIQAFPDSEEKKLGSSFHSPIETVIRSAKVHIAIFSKRYAESPFCLEELVLMIESKAKIIPLFYEVEPWELRHIEKGAYAGAFLTYKKKGIYMEKIQEWEKALQTVSLIAGIEFQSDRDCQKIVAVVQDEVQRKTYLHVARYPVGLDNLVEDFERRCLDELVQDFESQRGQKEGKRKAQVVGIFGMGGAGKTTLAKELFNRRRSDYNRACFLFDLRETSVRGQLPSLQSKLVKGLFGQAITFTSTDEGTAYLKDLLQRSPLLNFLIVVDDIDHVDQLNALAILDVFKHPANSLVIVTTRDLGVLRTAGITVCYNLKGMDKNYSRKLFCWHAFQQAHPYSEYEGLVESFVDVCGGLPLSLQVLGSHVHAESDSYWRSELIKVRRTLPWDVKQRLLTSFNSLDDEEKQMFMDSACFFNGKPKSIAERVWEASGWNKRHALQTLKDRCLVEEIENLDQNIEGGIVLRMHDHLRDLGREMALELSPPHRLWRPQDLQPLTSVNSINILTKNHVRCFHSIFDESTGSKVTFFIGDSSSLPWLQLEGNSKEQPSIPSWLPLQNLQCLKIHLGRFKTLWENSIQAPSQLKELQISQTSLKEFPDFLGISDNLENVDLNGKTRLRGLEKLEISSEEFLSRILISGIHYPRLQSIKLNYMESLLEVSLTGVETLNYLDISNCQKLKRLAAASDLPNLVLLNISQCPELKQLSFGHLSCLEKITIEHCEKLEYITLPTTLISLSVRSCRNLQRVEGTDDLMKLEEFEISDCGKLEFEYSWKDKEHAPLQLRELIITGTWSASFEKFPSSISYLNNLKKIALLGDVGKEFGIKELPEEFCRLQSLERLELRHCTLLSSLPDQFGGLKNLQHLDLCFCKELRMLPVSFQQLTLLKYLDLSGCERLILHEDVLENIRQLENLYLSGCLALLKLPHQITDQACLRELKLQHTHLEDLPGNIGQLSRLEVLTIGSPLLQSLPDSLGNLSSLKSLLITNCLAVESLPNTLGHLVLLEYLCIEATGMASLPEGFGQLANLRTLKIYDCPLSDLDFGSVTSFVLGNLTEIDLSETLVTRISIPKGCCSGLETLRLSKNDNLEVIETLPVTVKNIELSECETLKNIKGILALPTPLNLTISDCPEVEKP